MAADPRQWWGSLKDAASCCAKGVGVGGFSRYAPSDETEDLDVWGSLQRPPVQNPTLQQVQQLRASLQDRVAVYQEALLGPPPRPPPPKLDRIDEELPLASAAATSASTLARHSKPKRRRPATKAPPKNPCAVCHKEIYARDPIVHSFGKKVHLACFACQLCGSRLTGNDPLEVQFDLPNDDYYEYDDGKDDQYAYQKTVLCLVCAPCQRDSVLQGKAKVAATVAGTRVEPSEGEQGDVEGVREAIGGELEDIVLSKMIPRCGVCGEDFLNYQGNIAMVGQTKYHQECWETGRPRKANSMGQNGFGNPPNPQEDQRYLTPSQAARYLPDRWILRVRQRLSPLLENHQNHIQDGSILATLFFVWTTKNEDWKALRAAEAEGEEARPLIFVRDTQAGSLRTKVSVSHVAYSDAAAASTLSVELLPIDHPLEGTLSNMEAVVNGNAWCLERRGSRYGVDHILQLVFPAITNPSGTETELSLEKVELSMTLRSTD